MNKNTKKQWALAIGFALSAAAFPPAPVHAAGGYWVCDNDWWDSSSCWSDGGQPQNGDSAFLIQSDGAYRSVSYRTSDPSAVLNGLVIDATGGGMMVLWQSQDPLAANYEVIGIDGTGVFAQDGGTNTVGSDLYLGYNSTGSGTYYLVNTGSLSVGTNEYIGFSSTGIFIQDGPTHTVGSDLYLGYNSTGSGTYDLSSGSLSVAGSEHIGDFGSGAFVQRGGTHTVGGDLYLGYNSTGSGTYYLGGTGTLNVGGSIVNGAGTGSLILDGGTLTVGSSGSGGSIEVDNLVLGQATGSNVSFNLTPTGLFQGASKVANTLAVAQLILGYSGTGAFTQSGGTNTVDGYVSDPSV